jgi:triosephosphate isomerase (TIM)
MKTIIANWKMQLGVRESIALARGVLRGLRGMKEVPNVFLAPSFTAMTDVGKVLGRSRVRMAAQDMNAHDAGAYTGDVSAKQIKEVGAHAVILGHSERRLHVAEVDSQVRAKVEQAVKHGLEPIVCIGEPISVRESGEAVGYIHNQIQSIFEKTDIPKRSSIMIAYEPLWAIGTGLTPSISDVSEINDLINAQLKEAGFDRVQILYGGSVTSDNLYEFLNHDSVDGVLVGGASIRIKSLLELLSVASEIK